MKKTDSETEQKVIQSYLAGNSMAKVGKQFGVNAVTVMNILRRNNISARTVGGINPIPQEELAQLYKSGVRVKALAKKYGCSASAIDQHLQKAGVVQNYQYYNQQLDRHYFDEIDRKDKAYFLGYLLTDGYVSKTTNDVAMMLAQRDLYILELFKETVHSSNKIGIRESKRHYHFRLKCREWKEALAKYSVIPGKTYTATFPVLPNEAMMPHFIRGIIDGDGWVSYKARSIGLCGTQALLTGFRDYLVEKVGVKSAKIYQRQPHLWYVNWCAKADIKKIGQYIYADKGCYYLTRKFLNFCKLQDNTEVTSGISKGSEAPQSVEGE